MSEINYKSEYEALLEVANVARGWGTYGLTVDFYREYGWVIYSGPYPLPIHPDGTIGTPDDTGTCFTTAREAVDALKTFCATPKAEELFGDEDDDCHFRPDFASLLAGKTAPEPSEN